MRVSTFIICAVCDGTSDGLSTHGDSTVRYAAYKARYTDCTYVEGNLEIAFLDSPNRNFDLSFLSTIKQVRNPTVLLCVHQQTGEKSHCTKTTVHCYE